MKKQGGSGIPLITPDDLTASPIITHGHDSNSVKSNPGKENFTQAISKCVGEKRVCELRLKAKLAEKMTNSTDYEELADEKSSAPINLVKMVLEFANVVTQVLRA
eukprot:TRINITY_DN16368_c0_g1_i2.p3 TRINITY_DN16368_c0_g1~~TRINITY_DN16368_c0_g1_i2.p3  ORF type:complete len:105 (-),score=38.36 TRINITY_DN16368_c0_g1_i2:551-865(-)